VDHAFVIKSQSLVLRPLAEHDIEPLRVLRNKPDNRKWFVYNEIIPPEAQVNWFKEYLSKHDDIVFVIAKNDTPNDFMGTISLYNITQNQAEFGRFLIDSESAENRGYACEAVKAVVAFAFESLRLQKVYLYVFKTNGKAIHVYKKAGFVGADVQSQQEMIYMEIN
jgi:diamine N-acetyltransferase